MTRLDEIRRDLETCRQHAAVGAAEQMADELVEDIAWLLGEIARRDKVLEEVRALANTWPGSPHTRGVYYRNAVRKVLATLDTPQGATPSVSPHAGERTEMLGGIPQPKHHDATYPTDGEQPGPDWRPLGENVEMHTMLAVLPPHEDGRTCMYHARLGKWTFDWVNECLRTHPDPYKRAEESP